MRKIFFIFIFSCLLSISRAYADSWHLVVIPEFLASGNADDHFKDVAKEQAASNSGYSVSSTGGFGIRAGLLRPLESWKRTYVGGSIGYLVGPKIKSTIYDNNTPGTFGVESREYYYRALAEGVHLIPVASHVGLKLGAGLGVARATTNQTPFFTGGLTGDTSKHSHTNFGFTYEISPAVVLDLQATILELGIRYMYFPTIKETAETASVEWTTFGFYVGLGF